MSRRERNEGATRRRGKREGTICQRHDGRWVAVVDLGFIDGRRTRKSFYGTTRAAVAKRLTDALNRHDRGANVNTNDVLTVAKHLDAWLSTVSVRPKTRRQYEQATRLYLKPAIGPVRLSRLGPDHVRGLVRGLELRGLSARTATLARDVLRIALTQAVDDGTIARNVAAKVKRPKPKRREYETLSPEQGRALLDALVGHRLEAVVTCGIALGLRISEVLGLQWPDLDLAGGWMSVRWGLETIGKTRHLVELKSDESRRRLRLPAVVRRGFERHKVAQAERRLLAGAAWQKSDFVFTTRTGRPYDATLVTRDLKTFMRKVWTGDDSKCVHSRAPESECLDCGATRIPVISFHGLRHSCASLLLADGVPVRDVSELLGHSDIRLTLDTYAHVIDANKTRTAAVIDRLWERGAADPRDNQSDNQTDNHRTGNG
jgi:integrase